MHAQEEAPRGQGVPLALHRLQSLVGTQLAAPAGLTAEVATQAEAAGLIPAGLWQEGSPGWEAAWRGITGVWASKWNDRAWLSRQARGVKESDLYMACLLQQVSMPGLRIRSVMSIVSPFRMHFCLRLCRHHGLTR